MARIALTLLVALIAIVGGFYQLTVKPKLAVWGQGRVIESLGNSKCKKYSELKACEKIVLHQPTGQIFAACSSQTSRINWIPAVGRLNAAGKGYGDYVARFDPSTEKVVKLTTPDFKFPRGLGLHGMDVVQNRANASELFVYLVNHRPPMDWESGLPGTKAEDVGADSVIEVFRTAVRGSELKYLGTFQDETIKTPNDIVGSSDGSSFYFTNDHGNIKTGLARKYSLDAYLSLPWSNVAYCHALDGCKIVASNLVSANGITRDKYGNFWIGSSTIGKLYVFERQSGDGSLVLLDEIKHDRPVDNLSVDDDGAVWAAGIPNAIHFIKVHFANPSINTPSSALKITLNQGQSQYYGEKYKVEKMFEDDGSIASGSTSVVYDSKRKRLFLHGISAPHLTVCEL